MELRGHNPPPKLPEQTPTPRKYGVKLALYPIRPGTQTACPRQRSAPWRCTDSRSGPCWRRPSRLAPARQGRHPPSWGKERHAPCGAARGPCHSHRSRSLLCPLSSSRSSSLYIDLSTGLSNPAHNLTLGQSERLGEQTCQASCIRLPTSHFITSPTINVSARAGKFKIVIFA